MGDLIKSPNFLNLTSLSMFEIILTNMSRLLSFLFFSFLVKVTLLGAFLFEKGYFFKKKNRIGFDVFYLNIF